MARILVYTSPALGHLYPALGPALELAKRGHDVHMVTMASEVARVSDLGIRAEPMDPAIEACVMDDYTASNPLKAVQLAVATFSRRAPYECAELRRLITQHAPDLLLVDTNCFGARTAAEASGLPWGCFQPFFTPLPSAGVPPFGPGLPLARGWIGRLRDQLIRPLVTGSLEKLTLSAVNPLRDTQGLAPVKGLTDFYTRPTKTLYFTTADLDYPREDWPASFVLCGPASWEPGQVSPAWLPAETRPLVLVTCSTEAQSDQRIIATALEAFGGTEYAVVATSAAMDPELFEVPSNARVERFLPHGPLLEKAVAVICHGGMGITQKALARGVPVCVVPFGRDQLEVARRVEHAGVGVRLPARQLTAKALRDAVQRTRACAAKAAEIAQAFQSAGGSVRAADELLGLVD